MSTSPSARYLRPGPPVYRRQPAEPERAEQAERRARCEREHAARRDGQPDGGGEQRRGAAAATAYARRASAATWPGFNWPLTSVVSDEPALSKPRSKSYSVLIRLPAAWTPSVVTRVSTRSALNASPPRTQRRPVQHRRRRRAERPRRARRASLKGSFRFAGVGVASAPATRRAPRASPPALAPWTNSAPSPAAAATMAATEDFAAFPGLGQPRSPARPRVRGG